MNGFLNSKGFFEQAMAARAKADEKRQLSEEQKEIREKKLRELARELADEFFDVSPEQFARYERLLSAARDNNEGAHDLGMHPIRPISDGELSHYDIESCISEKSDIPEKAEKLFDPDYGPMRVIGFMSGTGTNLRRILEHERNFDKQVSNADGKSNRQGRQDLFSGAFHRAPYKVVAIFSNRCDSNALHVGRDFDLPVIVRDIAAFYNARRKPRKDPITRLEYDEEVVRALAPYEAHAAAYAGYMSWVTAPLVNAFLGINVHPADLSIEEVIKEARVRKYRGDDAVFKAIFCGEKELRSTTHLVSAELDAGKLLMISEPLIVSLSTAAPLDGNLINGQISAGVKFPREAFAQMSPEEIKGYKKSLKDVVAKHQEALKYVGDWKIFPLTLQYIAEGRYARDRAGKLYFDSKEIPFGLRIEEQKH